MTILSLPKSLNTGKVLSQEGASYPKIAKMQAVEASLGELLKDYKKEEVLVIFDIDFTLLLPQEPPFQVYNRIAYRDKLTALFQDLDIEQASMLINCMTSFPSELVDPEAAQVIENLQAQNIKVIACTASMTGALGPYERAESMRFDALKKQNIDFSRAFPTSNDMELSDIKGFLQRSPVFYKGILFSNGLKNKPCKGEAILSLLEALAFSPKIIIFVDDKTHYLADVEASLKAQMPHVVFKGIEFTGETMHTPEILTEAEFLSAWQELKDKASVLLKACTEKL
jgi:hypothetical protein